ncbi:hypothetical protein GCM10009678_47420 [Actinomadura kijaniata]|uniref:Uncharacterized protein n=1 Tax=Actinomadura namibiensis TaxID=182080 RepID=A0A7W3QK16_ACTNM|nr:MULTISPECIES: hypothetical protein [Actinomadura]MBA8949946.1 hypothetical protein [Actinomadura namibiensis]
MAQAIRRDGLLLVPHDVGDGVTIVEPNHPDYERLASTAMDFDALRGTPQRNQELVERFRRRWARQERRTA